MIYCKEIDKLTTKYYLSLCMKILKTLTIKFNTKCNYIQRIKYNKENECTVVGFYNVPDTD